MSFEIGSPRQLLAALSGAVVGLVATLVAARSGAAVDAPVAMVVGVTALGTASVYATWLLCGRLGLHRRLLSARFAAVATGVAFLVTWGALYLIDAVWPR
ncbi:hypothetical protein AB0G74_30575 [Streptomyces sp. NPDC020875]|uniref:hypothetical protein n=1 Tax=Streptomyces sp. NPDC020875 TaxID=3154898 RepID=UPI0033DE5F88